MDEEFLQTYLNKLANRVNELQQENLLLKAQLDHANVKIKKLDEIKAQDKKLESPFAEAEAVLKTEEEVTYNTPPTVKKLTPEDFPKGKKESLGDRIRREKGD